MDGRPSNKPIIVVTGASGFIGRNFINTFHDSFYIYALARRPQHDAEVSEHKNVNWIRLDIGDEDAVEKEFKTIAEKGGADYVLHLAGYYDFDGRDSIEYERTNINGTKYILDNTKQLNIKRFVFSSSLTVTDFSKPDTVLNEQSPADAKFPYAESKRICELMIRDCSENFPCTVLRLAAIFSDWCEYGPLYMFLKTWFSKNWNSRILAGKGESAVPYLHVDCLNQLINRIFEKTEQLPDYQIYTASPDGCTSHKELYNLAIRYYFGSQARPVFVPKLLAFIGVWFRDVIGRMRNRRPFERPWMIRYIDWKMETDASLTRKQLSWMPISRYHIKRRLLFLIENMKSDPYEWNRKNYAAMYKTGLERPNFLILENMILMEEDIISAIYDELVAEKNKHDFPTYRQLGHETLLERVEIIYGILKHAVRSGDRLHILSYARSLAMKRIEENFKIHEVLRAVNLTGQYIVRALNKIEELEHLNERIHDEIMLTIQLFSDEVEDAYERFTGFSSDEPISL